MFIVNITIIYGSHKHYDSDEACTQLDELHSG